MSRDKFEYIMTHIHFSDNLNLDESDKSAKLRPIFDHLNKCFLKYASPEEYHSVDEAMVPYNRRHVNSIFTETPFDMGSSFGLALHVLDT
nr:unnamed protein product [Callosobruchus chinensis]